MNKEEILKVAQEEKRGDEYEKKACIKGNFCGTFVAIILGVILFVIEYLIKGFANISLIACGMTLAGVQLVVEGIKAKKIKHVIIGVLFLIVAFIALLGFVGGLLEP